ncbi:945_t:CDS:2, partial [Racocetra persica]
VVGSPCVKGEVVPKALNKRKDLACELVVSQISANILYEGNVYRKFKTNKLSGLVAKKSRIIPVTNLSDDDNYNGGAAASSNKRNIRTQTIISHFS